MTQNKYLGSNKKMGSHAKWKDILKCDSNQIWPRELLKLIHHYYFIPPYELHLFQNPDIKIEEGNVYRHFKDISSTFTFRFSQIYGFIGDKPLSENKRPLLFTMESYAGAFRVFIGIAKYSNAKKHWIYPADVHDDDCIYITRKGDYCGAHPLPILVEMDKDEKQLTISNIGRKGDKTASSHLCIPPSESGLKDWVLYLAISPCSYHHEQQIDELYFSMSIERIY